MNTIQIVIFGVCIFFVSFFLAVIIYLFACNSSRKIDEDKKIKLKTGPLKNGDLGWDDLEVDDLCIVNFKCEAFYGN